MSIQQMMMGGRLKPSYISTNTYFSTSDTNDFELQVPANVEPGDLLVFLGSYEQTSNRNWTGNTSFEKVFDYSDFTIGTTCGITLWKKTADATDVPGKKYIFSMNGGRKVSTTLAAFRNGRVGANGAIYSSSNPGTLNFTVAGASLTYSPSVAVVYLVNGRDSNAIWTISTPGYTTISSDSNGIQPSTLVAYQDNVTTNPVPDVSASHNGDNGDETETVMFIVE